MTNVMDQDSRAVLSAVRSEIGKVVVGQEGAVTACIAALLVGGHVLFEGVPGVAKTLLARSLAASLNLEYKRVQFTPDLMPSDVTGQMILSSADGSTHLKRGPIFANVFLADEINRTPPKTQAALLEAMEERNVTIDGTSNSLPDPFICVATQNPVEYEGTYPLPEAQLDRFLFKILVNYPTLDQEISVVGRHDVGLNVQDLSHSGINSVASTQDVLTARSAVASLRVDPQVQRYMVELCRATRVSPSVALGVSPRGSVSLLKASKAWAWLSGRDFVTPDDVKTVAKPTLRHRIQLRPEVELEGVSADGVLDGIMAIVPVPR